MQGLKERTELFFNELLSLPSSPAVVNLEVGNPRGDFNPTLAHLEAAERTGVPVVSFRDLLSFPDDPRFESFSNKPIFESFAKKLAVNNSSSLSNPIQPRGWFRRSPAVAGRRLGGQIGNDPALHPDAAGFYNWELEEGRSFDEARNHLYLQVSLRHLYFDSVPYDLLTNLLHSFFFLGLWLYGTSGARGPRAHCAAVLLFSPSGDCSFSSRRPKLSTST